MTLAPVHDAQALVQLFRRTPAVHAYALGDLAEPFIRRSRFLGLWRETQLWEAVALYDGLGTPCLIAHASHDAAALAELVNAVLDGTRGSLMVQGDPELGPVLERHGIVISDVGRTRMVHAEPAALPDDDPRVVRLGPADASALSTLYDLAYPGSWFDPSLLEFGRATGVWRGHDLLATAGLHVFAPDLGVAVIGNVTTRPDARRRGFARSCTGALVRQLRADCETVVLNVATDDPGARALYLGLGFQPVYELREWTVAR